MAWSIYIKIGTIFGRKSLPATGGSLFSGPAKVLSIGRSQNKSKVLDKNGKIYKISSVNEELIIMAEGNTNTASTSHSKGDTGKSSLPPPNPNSSQAPPPPPNQAAPPPVPGAPVPNHPKAIPALVLGIIACGCFLLTWVFGSFGFGLCCPPIGVVCGIIALVLGFKVRKDIKNTPNKFGGDGQALGGMICGGIALGLCALQIIIGILIAILFTAYILAFLAIPLAIIGCKSGILSIGIGLGMVVAICSLAKVREARNFTHISRKK